MTDVVAIQDTAYVGVEDVGLWTMDLSDPSRPAVLGHLLTLGATLDVEVLGGYAYICELGEGLRVVDVSDPTQPVEVWRETIGDSGTDSSETRAHRVLGHAPHLYVYFDSGSGMDSRLAVYDIADPAEPRLLAIADEHLAGTPLDAAMVGTLVCAIGQQELTVFDVSEPQRPRVVHRWDPMPDYYPRSLASASGLVFVGADSAGSRPGLVVLAIDAAAITELGYLQAEYLQVLTADSEYVCVLEGAADRQAIRAVAAADPQHPVSGGVVRLEGSLVEAAMQGSSIVAISSAGTLWSLHRDETGMLQPLGSFEPQWEAYQIEMAGDMAAVTAGSAGLRLLEVSVPTQLREVGLLTPDSDAQLRFGGLALDEGVAFVVSETPKSRDNPAKAVLHVIDIADAERPREVGTTQVTAPSAFGVAVSGERLAVLATQALEVVDVTDRALPRMMGELPLVARGRSVAGSGGDAVVVTTDDGVLLIDIGDPAHLTIVSEYQPAGRPYGVAATGDLAFVASIDAPPPPSPFPYSLPADIGVEGHASSVRVLNLSQDSELRQVARVGLPGSWGNEPGSVVYAGESVLVAAEDAGLLSIRITGTAERGCFLPWVGNPQ